MQGRILARKEIRISCCSDTTRDFEILEVFTTNSRQSGHTVARRYLRLALAQFNKMKEDSTDGERQVEQFIDSYEVDKEKKQNKITIKLPADMKKILVFFGAIDYFVQHMQYQSKNDGVEIAFYLDDSLLPAGKVSVASKMAKSFISKTRKQDTRAPVLAAVEMISNYLLHPLTPISIQIFHRLHPDKSLAPDIASLTKNELEKQLTFPDTNYQQKSEFLLSWLQTSLMAKSSRDKPNKASDAFIHQQLNLQLKALAALKNKIWELMVRSVYGKPACDGGCYDSHYYEVNMLCLATLALNEEGCFELDYTHTKIYKDIYAKSKEAEPELKTEIIALLKYLGLQLKPDQDFHGKLLFTHLSNEELMRRGLGWTKSTCINVIKWGRFFKGIKEVPVLDKADSNLQKFIASLVPLR